MRVKNWETLTLEAVCLKITDGAHSSPPSVPDGKPMASVKDLTPYGIRLESCRRIPDGDFKKLVKQGCQPMKGDVLIAKDGATALDTVCEVKKTEEVVLLSSVAILRPNPSIIDSSYLQYFLRASATRSYLKSNFISGAAIPRVVLKDLKRSVVTVPHLSSQQRIATILSAYDELIENSQRRIRILESMAHALYREWFVHFRFPGHEHHPRVASPLGEIPEGWDVKPCSALASYVNGYPFKPAQLGTEGKPIIKIKELKAGIVADTPRNPGDEIPAKYVVHDGHILFSWSAHLDAYLWMGGEGLLNQHLFNVLPNEGVSRDFLFHALKEVMPRFRALSLGATMHHIKRSALDQVFTLLPSEQLRKHFDSLVKPMHLQLITLTKHVENLRRTRDLLLPRLLSGQIPVEAEAA